jgi:hypothetical protein
MSYRKVYLYDDLKFFAELIDNEFKKLNKDKDIIYPTEQRYKELIKDAIDKITGIVRCQGIYATGIHKGENCRAVPYGDSKYCRKHEYQNPKNKEGEKAKSRIKELINLKNTEQNPEKKKLYETEIIELTEKINLNNQ